MVTFVDLNRTTFNDREISSNYFHRFFYAIESFRKINILRTQVNKKKKELYFDRIKNMTSRESVIDFTRDKSARGNENKTERRSPRVKPMRRVKRRNAR